MPAYRPPFIWLHLKKCAGQSMRAALGDCYRQTDRLDPRPFVALPPEEWNDCLNNYRVPLGDFDYRRMLFAREHLYGPEAFDAALKFAVVRNPYDRLVSCWKYVRPESWRVMPRYLRSRLSLTSFLEMLPEIWESKADRHLATHTAPIWPDVSDRDGTLLLDEICRLETIAEDFARVALRIGAAGAAFPHENRNRDDTGYRRHYTRKSRALLERLYAADLENLGYDF
jgi:hypothetical protein